MNIVLIGMPGCGKTSIGSMLAKKLGRKFYDTDAVIEAETGRTIPQIFEMDGEGAFREMESKVAERFAAPKNAVVATGGGIVLNPLNMEHLKRGGRIYFINRPLERILEDIETGARPLLKGGKDRLHALHEQRLPLYRAYAYAEIINDRSINDVISEVCRHENIGN